MKILGFFFAGLILGLLLESGAGLGAVGSNIAQTVSGGGVTVKVIYLNPKSNENPRFRVLLDTHSVNLDSYDLKGLTVLRDETGKSYLPTDTENKGSGHHRETILTFPKLSTETKRLEIAIKDVAGVKERTFSWNPGVNLFSSTEDERKEK